jgi:hypothetical protein
VHPLGGRRWTATPSPRQPSGWALSHQSPAISIRATYQVLVTQQARQRLRGAPPLLAGSVAGIIAVLRVDPTEASMIFRRRRLGDAGWTMTFGAAGGLLTYWVLPAERIVVLLDLTWSG